MTLCSPPPNGYWILEGSPRTRIIQAAASRQDWPRDPVAHGPMQVSNAIGKAVDE